MKRADKTRCVWADGHPLLTEYHDREWSFAVHDDRSLFEMINLEGAQAGLSWLTVLKKRAAYRKAFADFDAAKILRMAPAQRAKLMLDKGIVRNRLKIAAVFANARSYLAAQKEFGSFDAYLWQTIGGRSFSRTEAKRATEASETLSKDLKKRGFRFVGPTICFAFMQGVGMIDDHAPNCFRAAERRVKQKK